MWNNIIKGNMSWGTKYHITEVIIKNIEEGRGFTKFITIIAPEFKIPSRNTIKSRIEKIYCDKKEKLITELDQIEYVSLITYTWTLNSTKSLMTVTDHHIDH